MKNEKQVNKKIKKERKKIHEKIGVSHTTMQIIYSILLFFLGVYFLASAFEYGGRLGSYLFSNLSAFVGWGYYVFPVLFFLMAYVMFKNLEKEFGKNKIIASILFYLSSLSLLDIFTQKAGWLGQKMMFLKEYLGLWMTGFFYFILGLISLVIIFDGVPVQFFKRKVQEYSNQLTEDEEEKIEKKINEVEKIKDEEIKEKPKSKEKGFDILNLTKKIKSTKKEEKKEEKKEDKIKNFFGIKEEKTNQKIILPPLSLVSKDKGKPDAGDIKENANIIKNTLASFGISVEIDSVSIGPTVTRYALKPAQGVRLSKISALHDNLALALAAPSVVIQAPIPGKSLVGIEVPNKKNLTVGIGSLLSSEEFQNSPYELPLALGKGIEGKPAIMGLEEAPHVLVAGQTGSGKSVTVHAMLISLLYKHGPDSLKLILVDPKKVEFSVYNGLPHLIDTVIKDVKKVILALKWAVDEMERRYSILEEKGIRNIKTYHEKVYQKALEKGVSEDKMPERMPYIVIVLDELADIMQKYPKELEAGIVSLAQKARAVGIHLIISTQRPTVNVVTGLIKANVPARVALSVASAMESRTILDEAGAEKLLGKGDLLYKDGKMLKPKRVQAAFVSEDEVKKVVDFIKKAYKEVLDDRMVSFGENESIDENEEKYSNDLVAESKRINQSEKADLMIAFDELERDFEKDDRFDEALEIVVRSGKASTSYLQRKMSIGYSRAAKIIDDMEEMGIIGPQSGSKPREVLWSEKELEDYLNK